MKAIGIIPARFASTRLPGKPMLLLNDLPMIHWVYNSAKVSKSLNDLYVATDSAEILNYCQSNQIPCILTSSTCQNGTERTAEAIQKLNAPHPIVVNIQGDEPFLKGSDIDLLVSLLVENPAADIGTLIKPTNDTEAIANPSIIKVAKTTQNKALYFSRAPIPFQREASEAMPSYFKHIGMYAFRQSLLHNLVALPESELERAEKLEQLRWLENGYSIYLAQTDTDCISIDTPKDYEYAKSLLI